MKVLVLILASNNEQLYMDLQGIWRKYMHRSDVFECYFNVADPNLEGDWRIDGDTLYVKCPEDLNWTAEKMRLGFSAFESRLHEFDYILRTNLSSFIIFDRYRAFLECVPTGSKYLVSLHDNNELVTDGHMTMPTRLYEVSGTFITMTPSIVRAYIQYPIVDRIDDKNMTTMLEQFPESVSSIICPRVDILDARHENRIEYIKDSDIFHVRIKYLYNRAKSDIEMHEKLYSLFYSASA